MIFFLILLPFQNFTLPYDSDPETVFEDLKKKIGTNNPEIAFFFDSERNYQKIVKETYRNEPNAFNQTRSLWVFTEEFVNINLEYVKEINHIQIGFLSNDLTQEEKVARLNTNNKSCNAFQCILFIDKGSEDKDVALRKFKNNLIDHLAKTSK